MLNTFERCTTDGTYAALALDLDGSLLEADDTLSEKAVRLLQRARDAGVLIVLATGRMYCSALQFWRRILPQTPIVAYNGAYIRRPDCADDGLIYHVPVAVDDARALLAECERDGVHMNAYLDDVVCVAEDAGLGRWYADYYRVPLKAVGPLSQWICKPSTKLLAIAETAAELPEMERRIAELADGRAVRLTTSSDRYVEILHPDVSKAGALDFLARSYGIPADRWVALGDSGNDLEMIQAAGVGCAVAGSLAESHPHDVVMPQGWRGISRILSEFFDLS